MCYQLIERYSACRCLYYLHAVDKCASYGRRGHTATSREIAVGYACPSHGGDFQSKSPPIDEGEEATSDAASLFSVRSSASTSLSIPSEAGDKPVERLFRDLLTEPHLEHLFPQVVRISKTQEDAEQIISRFLRRFSHDLKSRSETVEHFQASRYVRQCRQDIARRIAECHSAELDEVCEKDQASFVHQVKKALVENENDGDNEEIDILYDDLTEFLFSGPAFESFHGSIREFVDKSGAQSTNWLPDQYKWLYDDYLRCVNVINDLIGKYICPPRGRRRLWWTCSCGRRLHDDFRELRPGALNDLQDFLLSYLGTPATRPDGFPRVKLLTLVMTLFLPASFVSALMSSGMFTWEIVHVKPEDRQKSGFASPWALYWVSVTGWALVFLLVLIEWLERHKLPVSTTATASPDPEAAQDGSSTKQSVEKQRSNLLGRFRSKGLPRHHQDTNGPDLTKCSIRNALPGGEETHRFLLLCIPFLKWGLKLQQPDVCRIHSDRDFFKLLRKAYLKHRVGKHWRWLRRVKQLDFCQFELYHDSLVDIRAMPSMPSFEARHEYDFELPDTDPPIGPNMLMHLLENPDHAPVLPILVRKIPMKRKQRLQPCPIKGSSAGWGINFMEGVEGKAVFACAFIGFVLSLVAAVTWTVVLDDVQGGFGIGAFILAFSLFCSTKLEVLIR